ncbi:RidA family protein [Terrihabitans rhizophilus]|uniref:RidA family protein n=1 Tax=Terrihabitans rhizophilus TaxID=3092662 RepID=A0ABU4RJ16_9HYPH|nr:RidA family protein [Terrihabitans sp. PJ23]MDX6804833.1 RidA family protein [Terrihabitans sp. PJ23]
MSITRSDFTGRFCRIVEAGGFVFLSGVVAQDETGHVTAQTRDVLGQIDDLLAKAGVGKSDLVTANIWLANIADIATMNAAWDEWVDRDNAPVRATVESKLARPEFLVEIQVQAYRQPA